MANPIRHIRRHLRHSDAVAALLDEVERRERLLRTIREAIPPALAAHCRHASLNAGRLTLVVDSPVWVDRLRFLSPQFIDALTATGAEVSQCRVRAAPGGDGAQIDIARTESLPRSAMARICLEQAAAALGGTELAGSLTRLARSCGHREATGESD